VKTAALNDQHALLDVPAESPLDVGDLLGFGISHPCLTFDRWPLVLIVDDAYAVVSAVRTYF
jgi:D-serine dehydratase